MSKDKLKQFQKSLVSEYLKKSQYIFLLFSLIVGFLTVTSIGIVQLFLGDYPRAMYDFVSLIPFVIFFYLFLVKKKINATTIAALSGILISVIPAFYSGGIYGSALVYHLLIPVLVAFLVRFEHGRFLLLTYLLIIGSMFVLQLSGIVSTYFETGPLMIVVLNGFLLTVFCGFLSHRQERILFALNRERYFDSLTGYPNRKRLLRDLSIMDKPALLLVNIDNFKEVNDIFGYRDGDKILIKTADSLQSLLDDGGIVYRLSGADFGILLDIPDECEDCKKDFLTREVRNLLSNIEPVLIEEYAVNVEVSIGISYSPVSNIIRMISDSDIALQEAKRNPAKFVFYVPDLETERIFKADLEWKNEIEQAISEKRVFPFYQPIIENKSGQIIKYECLARLLNNKGSIHLPAEFLPIAQRNNLYPKITRSILKQAFESLNLHKRGISINLGASDLTDNFTRQYIVTLLNQYSHLGELIQFEILESEKIEDPSLIQDFIKEIKQFNCTTAIDDFGSGYSNFDYLSKYDIDMVKIDGSLIKNLDTDKRSFKLVANMVQFCRELNLKTVAEYVHNEAVFEKVQSLGIDYSQGFYFAKPAPIDEIEIHQSEHTAL